MPSGGSTRVQESFPPICLIVGVLLLPHWSHGHTIPLDSPLYKGAYIHTYIHRMKVVACTVDQEPFWNPLLCHKSDDTAEADKAAVPPDEPVLALSEDDDSWIEASCEPKVRIHEEPLKYNRQRPEEDVSEQQPEAKRQKIVGSKKKRCEFNEVVRVVPIPMRTEYSVHMRQRLWSNSFEIQQNAARNTIEFASEGWDWRSVILDESMYTCDKTGELIHPIHYEPYSLVVFDNPCNGTTEGEADLAALEVPPEEPPSHAPTSF